MSESLDWRVVSIYKETGAYAREHNELDAFRASNAANSSCVKDIEKAIADSWDGMRLKDGCALSVIEKKRRNQKHFHLGKYLVIQAVGQTFF